MAIDKTRKIPDAWVEKYRTSKVDAMILPPKIRKMFKQFVTDQNIPNNLLLESKSPGTGKTTIARALLNECGYEFKEINASVDNGVDLLRTTIERYASAQSFSGKKKAILLDEFDRASPALQDGMKAAMEKFLKTGACVFICICNKKKQLSIPLLSRLEKIDFSFSNPKYKEHMVPQFAKRMEIILEREGITFDSGVLAEFVDIKYPDFRDVINTCQQYARVNSTIDSGILTYRTIDSKLWGYILNKELSKARTYIAEHEYDYEDLFDVAFETLVPMLPVPCRPQAYIDLSTYESRSQNTHNKELHFIAFLNEVCINLNNHSD